MIISNGWNMKQNCNSTGKLLKIVRIKNDESNLHMGLYITEVLVYAC